MVEENATEKLALKLQRQLQPETNLCAVRWRGGGCGGRSTAAAAAAAGVVVDETVGEASGAAFKLMADDELTPPPLPIDPPPLRLGPATGFFDRGSGWTSRSTERASSVRIVADWA